jgi:DNA (cytosine-5)-methyltransferase 1
MSSHAQPLLVAPLRVDFDLRDGLLLRGLEVDSQMAGSTIPLDVSSGDLLDDWWCAYLRGVRPGPVVTSEQAVRTAELFCGPGGLAQGTKQACRELGHSFLSRFAIDNDANAVDVYELNHGTEYAASGTVTMLLDYKVRGRRDGARMAYEPEVVDERLHGMVGEIDLLLAGPPCQGHSNLNNKTRRDDDRNELYLTVPALAIAAQIPMVVIENVTAVVHDHSGVVQTAKTLFENAGYHLTEGVLKADKLGWPQTRGRYFLIARHHDLGPPIPLSDVASALAAEPRSVLWAIEDLADVEPDHEMHRQPEMNEDNVRRIDWLFDNDEYDLALDQRPDCHKDGTTYLAVYGRMRPDRPAPTLTTGFLTPGRGRFVHPTRRRVLTPHEAARIQGFPDTYRWRIPGQPPPTSSLLAKWIGDAVPMPLGHAATLSVLGPGFPT